MRALNSHSASRALLLLAGALFGALSLNAQDPWREGRNIGGITFYEGTAANKGKEIWHYEAKVNEKVSVYTLQGHSKRGGLMTASELTRHHKPGSIYIEATTGDRLLAAKEITLIKNKQ